MSDLDPTEAPVQNDTRSSDASKSGVRAAWDQWSASPENRASLLQFGLAMMSPQPKGQTFMGSIANGIGEGSEAAARNIAAQQAELEQESKIEERASTAAYRRAQSEAALKNAEAYGQQVKNMGSGGAGQRQQLSQIFRTQQAFRTWLAKPEDITGLAADPLLEAIKKEFPDVKSKGDLARNRAAMQRAFQIYTQSFDTEVPDATTPTAPPAAAQPPNPGASAAPVPQTNVRTFYDQETGAPRQFQWDGQQWTPIQ